MRIRFSLIIAALLIMSLGCTWNKTSVAADKARFNAVFAPAGPVEEFKTNHPDQAQTWDDFKRAWEMSIESREGVAK